MSAAVACRLGGGSSIPNIFNECGQNLAGPAELKRYAQGLWAGCSKDVDSFVEQMESVLERAVFAPQVGVGAPDCLIPCLIPGDNVVGLDCDRRVS